MIMLKKTFLHTIIKISSFLVFGYVAYGQSPLSISELKANGVSGFPQKNAKVLIDDQHLRVSIFNDSNYLAVQAIIWKDNDNQLGKNSIGQLSGDYSTLLISTENGNKRKPDVDRSYLINPLPHLSGLHYSIYSGKRKFIKTLADGTKVTFEAEATSPLKSDSKGRGNIEYVVVEEGQRIRIDTMLIPLAELNKKVGDSFRVCYFVSSSSPTLKFNSCGYQSKKDYFDQDILPKYYHKIILGNTPSTELNKLIP